MRTAKTQKSKLAAKQHRKDPLQHKNRPGQNGDTKAGADANAIDGAGLHLLTQGLRSMPLFEVALMTGDSKKSDLLSIIDTEAKQLQAIEDLYLVVKAQPKYKKMKEPEWSVDTKPVVVLQWLLRKLGPLAKGDNWTVDTYQDGNKTRYRFVIYKPYNSQTLRHEEEFISLDFLPFLVNRDKPLHDLIVDTVTLISKYAKVPLWSEDGDFSEALATFLKEPDNGNRVKQLQRQSYTTGPAASYLKLLKRRRREVTYSMVAKDFQLYEATSERKRILCWWIKSGISLALQAKQQGKSIFTNNYVPNYIKGTPLTPFRQLKFVWSLHSHDVLRAKAFYKLQKDEKTGSFIPVMFSIARPGKKLTPIRYDEFPELLYEFMSSGYRYFCGTYRDYFYKELLKGANTPAETLLEIIDQQEIKNNE